MQTAESLEKNMRPKYGTTVALLLHCMCMYLLTYCISNLASGVAAGGARTISGFGRHTPGTFLGPMSKLGEAGVQCTTLLKVVVLCFSMHLFHFSPACTNVHIHTHTYVPLTFKATTMATLYKIHSSIQHEQA